MPARWPEPRRWSWESRTVLPRTAATTIAEANGYTASGQTATVTVNIPRPLHRRLPVKAVASRWLSNSVNPLCSGAIWGVQTLPITVEAVAKTTMVPYSTAAILLLAPSGTAMTLSGSTQVVTVNGGIMVDSTSALSVVSSGRVSITAPALDLAGGIKYSGTNPDNAAITNYDQPNIPDPLAKIAAPSSSGMPVESSSVVNVAGTKSVTLNPGVYDGGISMSGSSSVTLNPGVYYINGGGINMSGSSSITGNGVLIYNTGGGTINLSGTGTISLSPMTTGTICRDNPLSGPSRLLRGHDVGSVQCQATPARSTSRMRR